MITIPNDSRVLGYLSAGQKGLITEGFYLLEDVKKHKKTKLTDYSYLVFPFAKAYEGFLKQLFLDLGFISKKDYEGDRFRIGRSLNPHLEKRFRDKSVYDQIVHLGEKELADELWSVWRKGRNQVFHYFPHNFKALTLEEAEALIEAILIVMEKAVRLIQR